MREYQENRKLRKIIFSRLFLVVMFVFLIFLIINTTKLYFKSRVATARNDKIKDNISELTDRKDSLDEEISRLETESGIEEEIRKNFDVAKPGEKVLIIVNKENGEYGEQEETSFFKRTWKSIKGRF